MLHTGVPEERILFTQEQRKQILKNNYGICAHCGKKLTTKTMTVEHIIPRSRGGKNEMANLCALCTSCNTEKKSIFFLPQGYYHALLDTNRYKEIEKYVREWYQALPEGNKSDLKRFPLITPRNTFSLAAGDAMRGSFRGHHTKSVHIPTMMLEWRIVGNELRPEVEAVTGHTVRDIQSYLCPGEERPEAGVYILKKVSTDKLLVLAGIRYHEEGKWFHVYIPWSDGSKNYLGQHVFTLVQFILYALCDVAQKGVQQYVVESSKKEALDAFVYASTMDPHIGVSYQCGENLDEDGNVMTYQILIQREIMALDALKAARETASKNHAKKENC